MPDFCQDRAERCSNSEMMSPTMPRTVSAASSVSQRKPLSRFQNERRQAGAFCALLTNASSCDSGAPMDLAEPFVTAFRGPRWSGLGTRSGSAPILLRIPAAQPRHVPLLTLTIALLKDDELRNWHPLGR